MESRQFDRLTKIMARGTNRRGAMKTLVVGALGGAGLARAAGHASAASGPGEEWVQLYESLAASVDTIDGTCSEITDALQAFQDQNADHIQQMHQDTRTWSTDQLAAHQTAYGDRIQDASISLHLSLTRCGYRPDSTSPFTTADINAGSGAPATPTTPVAMSADGPPYASITKAAGDVTALQQIPSDQCPTACEPNTFFSAGNCFLYIVGCAGADNAETCCWAGICVAGFNHDQCVQQCEICVAAG